MGRGLRTGRLLRGVGPPGGSSDQCSLVPCAAQRACPLPAIRANEAARRVWGSWPASGSSSGARCYSRDRAVVRGLAVRGFGTSDCCIRLRRRPARASPFGWLLLGALAGVGGLAAALWVVRRGIGGRPGVLMLASAAAFGVLTAAFVAAASIAPAFVLPLLLLVVGFAAQLSLIIGLTVMQLLVPDRLRGRVMGIWSMTTHLAVAGGFICAERCAVRRPTRHRGSRGAGPGGVRHRRLRGVGRVAAPAPRGRPAPDEARPRLAARGRELTHRAPTRHQRP